MWFAPEILVLFYNWTRRLVTETTVLFVHWVTCLSHPYKVQNVEPNVWTVIVEIDLLRQLEISSCIWSLTAINNTLFRTTFAFVLRGNLFSYIPIAFAIVRLNLYCFISSCAAFCPAMFNFLYDQISLKFLFKTEQDLSTLSARHVCNFYYKWLSVIFSFPFSVTQKVILPRRAIASWIPTPR